MTQLAPRHQIWLGLALAALMTATRSQHFAALHHLPEASWAVFFLAGVFLSSRWAFPALCGLAFASDWLAVTWLGVSSFCVTPAYAMLLPAYGVLWLAGRWYARRLSARPAALPPLAGALLGSALVAELLTSGGFYFLGGRFAEPTLAGFLPRLGQYFPSALGALFLYVGLAALVYGLVAGRVRPGDAEGPRTLMPGLKR